MNDEHVSVPLLYRLSDLMADELATFRERWTEMPEERRYIIVRHLADITEENFEVDFSDVFAHCLQDNAAPIREAALDGLWDTERVNLISPIVDVMEHDPSVKVRMMAAATLGHYVLLAEWGQIPAARVEKVVNALLAELENKATAVQVRRAALESLGAASHPKVPALIEDAYENGDLEMQLSAVFAMGRSADNRWLPIVLDEMGSPYEEMRLEAARAAGGIGDTEAADDLVDLTADDDLEVRLAAVTALGQIGGDQARQALERLAEDPDAEELYDAVDEALEEFDWLGGEVYLMDWEPDDEDDMTTL